MRITCAAFSCFACSIVIRMQKLQSSILTEVCTLQCSACSIVQCSGVEYTAETVEGLKYAGEGQAVIRWNIFYFFVDRYRGRAGRQKLPPCPLHLAPIPCSAGPAECITVLSLHSLVTWLPSPSTSLLPCHYSLWLELRFVQKLWDFFWS